MKQITCPHCADTYPDFDVAHVCSKGPYAPRLKPKMNERIKELERQATETVKCGLNGTSTTESFNRKKFAQLIVRECMDVVTKKCASPTAYNALVEHFGVEE